MKKVCIIRHNYYPKGPRVRKEVKALVDEGYEVDVLCLKNNGEKSRDNIHRVNVYRIPLSRRRGSITCYILQYICSFIVFGIVVSFLHFRKKYSVIQVNTMPDFLVFATIVPRLFGAKVILDMHEAMPELFMSKFGLSERHLITRLILLSERLSVRYADYVLAVGKSIRRLYVARGLNESKTVVIPNTPDENLFDYEKYCRPQDKEGKKEFVIISHGAILERYGFQVLIKAVPYLKQSIPDVKVVIIGEGEFLETLKELAKIINVQKHVSFMGMVPLEKVPLEISKADIGIVPIVKDSFTDLMAPNKLFEYVAMKKPVIASRTGGIQDYFDDSCLVFFEPGTEQELAKCIIGLYRKPVKAKELVENAWAKYNKIKWSATKHIYCDVFAKLSPN